jgi:serpin B
MFVTVVTLGLGTGLILLHQLRGAEPAGAPGEPAGARSGVQKAASGPGAGTQPASAPAFDANDPDVKLLVKGLNEFAIDLYKEIAKTEKGNMFFSPYSISSALAMSYAGARGKTAEEMAKVLHFPPELTKDDAKRLHATFGKLNAHLNAEKTPDGKPRPFTLIVANALWGQKGMRFIPAFSELCKAHYDGAFHEVDFASAPEEARARINAYVEGKTMEKIKDLFPPGIIKPEFRLVLTNAAYFKAAWPAPFRKELTKEEPFWVSPEKKVSAMMMHDDQANGPYAQGNGYKILGLPYREEENAMIIVLPDKKDALDQVMEGFRAQEMEKLLDRAVPSSVDVHIPKYKVTWSTPLLGNLRGMGMVSSKFSGISQDETLQLETIVHKAFVSVDEEGTEAAAATGVGYALMVGDREFRADHPFVFFIRDLRTGCFLFMGRLVDPTK